MSDIETIGKIIYGLFIGIVIDGVIYFAFYEALLRNNDPEYILLNTIVRLNLSQGEVRGLFERYLDNLFGPKSILDCERGTENEADILENGKIRVAKLYSKECDLLGIIPRDGFPDW